MTLRDLFKLNKTEEVTDATTETKMSDSEFVEGRIIHVATEGYGFITAPDIPFERIFFHWTCLDVDSNTVPTEQRNPKFPDLKKGMKVRFKPTQMPDRGYRAIKIRVIPNGD